MIPCLETLLLRCCAGGHNKNYAKKEKEKKEKDEKKEKTLRVHSYDILMT